MQMQHGERVACRPVRDRIKTLSPQTAVPAEPAQRTVYRQDSSQSGDLSGRRKRFWQRRSRPGYVSRNLTPDRTGRPEGGHTFSEFVTIMRTGKDFDHLHPSCAGAQTPGCLPAPFNGDVLQIMPRPLFKNMTDHDLLAIYEYLSDPVYRHDRAGPAASAQSMPLSG